MGDGGQIHKVVFSMKTNVDGGEVVLPYSNKLGK